MCIDRITLTETKTVQRIYQNIKKNLQRNIELAVFHKSNCLKTVRKKLKDALDFASYHLVMCIKHQQDRAHCKPYRFIDEEYKDIVYGDLLCWT